MHILHIVGSISPAVGGPTEAIRMLMKHQPQGYTAEAVTLNDPAESFLAEFPFRITALGDAGKSWRVPALTAWLRANKGRFDGAIVHGLWEYTGVAAHHVLGHAGEPGYVPYAVFPHGMLDPYFKRALPLKHVKKWIFWQLFQYRILRDAKRVLFTTSVEEGLARKSFKRWQWEPMVVSLGSEEPPADSQSLQHAFFHRYPALRGKSFLLFLGRIDPKKGCDLLIEAFARERPADREVHLVMAGPDSAGWQHELVNFAQKHGVGHLVHWPGMLKGDVKWGALAACEAFVLTSHQENFGIAVVEALASGKPVLISEPVNIAQDIADDGAGLVEPDTLEGAQALLRRWFALPAEQTRKVASQARDTFCNRYDMRKNTERILRVFDQNATQEME